MKKSINLKKYAFTVAESLTSLLIIGIIVIVTLCTTLNFDTRKEKNYVTLTKIFYGTLNSALQSVLINNTKNVDIRNLNDINNDGIINGEDLRDTFLKYLNGQKIKCSIKTQNKRLNEYFENSSCANITGKISAGFYLDTDCEETISDVKEYAALKDYSVRSVNNACGYIIYSANNLEENIIGKDTFIVALGKRSFK